MTTEAGVFADSRAVLIGVSAYEYADFPTIRAAHNSLQAMHALLSDPALCGWPPERITVIPDPISAADLASQVADLAESTTGVLLLYYVGHGVLAARGELCLTVTSTRQDRPKISGLAWETLADVLRACPARTRLAILDCCFAGQAIEALSGDADQGPADIAHVEGVYTLTATSRNRTAHVPPPDQQDTACTSFTGELRDLIRSGIPGKPPRLTFDDIYPVLRQRLRARGLPAPSQRGTDTAHQFPFTANAAVRIGPDTHNTWPEGNGVGEAAQNNREAARTDRAPATRILDDALRAARSITSETAKAEALARVAWALAATDPDRAERIARSITSETAKAEALADLTEALAATDPDRAERIARSITDKVLEAEALVGVAGALAAADPDRADRLSADAERVVRSIPDDFGKAEALVGLAWALAAADPDRAERIAGSITDKVLEAEALVGLAEALAAADPDRAARLGADAERIAGSITDKGSRATALARVAEALAAADPDRAARLGADAERVARSIPGKWSIARWWWWPSIGETAKAQALADVAGPLAAADPDRAERVARSIPGKWSFTGQMVRAEALVGVAGALAAATRTAPNASPGRSPTSGSARQRRQSYWPASRGRWQPPTRTAPNASPGRSPARQRRQRHWPTSRGRWQPPTRTAPNASPGRSPARTGTQRHWRRSRGRWQPPTRTAPNASPS